MALTLLRGEGAGAPAARHPKLVAMLTALLEAEVLSAQRMGALADMHAGVRGKERLRARLMVLAAFNRHHGERLRARLAALGSTPRPVPVDASPLGTSTDVPAVLRAEATRALAIAEKYKEAAAVARVPGDLSAAWVCELNQTEERDRARVLEALASEGNTP